MQPLDPHERELWISLRDYFDAILKERQERLDERFVAQEQAINKATSSLETRLILLNELRAGVLTRAEYDSKHELLNHQIADLEKWRANIMGRAVAIALIGAVLIAAAAAILTHIATA